MISVETISERAAGMSSLMFRVCSRNSVGTSIVKSDWTVALPAPADNVSEP